MKQRVALARTLANGAEVMLMDEPFAAVDAQTRMTLQEELLRLWNHSRVTVVFVTHSVEEAVFLADRVVVLTGGPGRVLATLPIDIPRDQRTWDRLRQDSRFATLCTHILDLVRSGSAIS
jgi:NitT/TauT family transport system ATP-binding protein